MIINVLEIIGTSYAGQYSDGLKLFKKLKHISDEQIISFEGIENATTAFLNASVGKFIANFPNKVDLIKFNIPSTNHLLRTKVDQVVENAKIASTYDALLGSMQS